MAEGAYSIFIDGKPVTSAFSPVLISLTITDSDGGKSDTCEIELDDRGGQISLPRAGAQIDVKLWWKTPPAGTSGGAVQFSGKTDEPTSEGARGGGMTISISATSADHKGLGKHKTTKHKDNAKFGDVAQEWGKKAGLQVKVDSSLASISRDYWHMANESFLAWGKRVAEDIGATFKVAHPNAVFVPRNSGNSASGAALSTVAMTRPGNIINWRLSPVQNRAVYKQSKVRWYDAKKAKWMVETVHIGDGDADLTETFAHADKDKATKKAGANAEDAKRGKGGGSVTIDGNPAAKSQASAMVSGVRAGIDGQYRITTARHSYTRSAGWTTSCDVEQPQGSTGTDNRKNGA
jgi:phage protein D